MHFFISSFLMNRIFSSFAPYYCCNYANVSNVGLIKALIYLKNNNEYILYVFKNIYI